MSLEAGVYVMFYALLIVSSSISAFCIVDLAKESFFDSHLTIYDVKTLHLQTR